MKANLLLDNKDGMLKDYANLDPFADGNDGRNKGDLHNLDWAFDAGELDELIADEILPYYGYRNLNEILKNWISKLKVGGKIIIAGTDFEEICRSYMFGKIDLKTACMLIFGEQNKTWDSKKSGISIIDVVNFLQNDAGLGIVKKMFENHEYYVEAVRLR